METVVIVVLVERTWQRVMERGTRREREERGINPCSDRRAEMGCPGLIGLMPHR